jgi:hypothetical protein
MIRLPAGPLVQDDPDQFSLKEPAASATAIDTTAKITAISFAQSLSSHSKHAADRLVNSSESAVT